MVSSPFSVTVGTTAVRAAHYSNQRTALTITNLGSATIYYGSDNGITTSNGFPIRANQTITFSEVTGDDPHLARWLISGSADQDVRIAEEYESDKGRGEGK